MSTSSQTTTAATAPRPSTQEASANAKADANAKCPPDKKAGGPTQSCPKCQDKKNFCDIESLKLTDTVSGRSVIAKEPFSRRATKHIADPAKAEFVLELVADVNAKRFEDPSDSPEPDATRKEATPTAEEDAKRKKFHEVEAKAPKCVKLKIEAVYCDKCAQGKHPFIRIKPTSGGDIYSKQSWEIASPPVQELYAEPGMGDKGRTGPGAKWLSPFWNFRNGATEYEIEATSCGTRASGAPNETLTGLVRIYRDDKYNLSFTMPAWKKIECEESRQIGFFSGESERKSEYSKESMGDTVASSSASTTTKDDKIIATESNKTYIKDDIAHSRSDARSTEDGKTTVTKEKSTETEVTNYGLASSTQTKTITKKDGGKRELVYTTKTEVKPTISLKRNDDEVDFTKVLNDLLNLHATLTNAWNDIQHWIPQWGWKFTFELSLFQGSIEGEWGTRFTDKHKSESALWCERFFEFTFDCKVIAYEAKLSFGIDFEIGESFKWFGASAPFQLLLEIAGTISGEAAIQAKLADKEGEGEKKEINGKPVRPVEFNGKSVMEVDVTGKISIMGMKYKAKGSFVGGIQFDGVLTGTLAKEPNIYGRAFFVETKAYAYMINKSGKSSKSYERIIWGEKTIWSGEIL